MSNHASDRSRFDLDDALREMLERRFQEDEAEPDDVISWDEVRTRTAARLCRSLANEEARGKPRG